MKSINWKGIVESLLFAAGDEGLSLKQIADALEVEEQKAQEILDEVKKEYEENNSRGIMLVQLAGTYQLVTKKKMRYI